MQYVRKTQFCLLYIIVCMVRYREFPKRASITAWSHNWMGKKDYILIPCTKSCLFCTELMSAMDTVVQTCIVNSCMENRGKRQPKRIQVILADFLAFEASGGLYTTYLLWSALFTRSCDLLENGLRCHLMESDCTEFFTGLITKHVNQDTWSHWLDFSILWLFLPPKSLADK